MELTSYERHTNNFDVLMENFREKFHDPDGRERSHDNFATRTQFRLNTSNMTQLSS